jgi:hypothetical protein
VLDCGHIPAVTNPEALAEILDRVADKEEAAGGFAVPSPAETKLARSPDKEEAAGGFAVPSPAETKLARSPDKEAPT